MIELLVVVSMIALLVAILLPSLRRAREQCRNLVCQNNLRSIWTGVLTYVYEHDDRLPYMEDVNLTDPNADPFSAAHPDTVGRVMLRYVNPGSWVCPSAVAGFPADAGSGNWKMTYTFSAAGKLGEGVPYDEHAGANSGGLFDPAVSNYVHFDGRPIRLLDGRRYVSWGVNQNDKGFWNIRREIIADALPQPDANAGRPVYPHRGHLTTRRDLQNYRTTFEQNTHTQGSGMKTGRFELHADKEEAEVYLTRFWVPHQPGY